MQSPTVNATAAVADPEQVELLLQPFSTPPDVAPLNALGSNPESPPVLAPLLLLLLLLLQKPPVDPLADAAGQVEKVVRHCALQSAPLQEVTGA